jgi:chromosome segregation ATPase
MQCLEDGASSISSRMEAANAACYTAVRSAFRRYFSHLIPTKSADLPRSASSATLQFTVANARGGGAARSAQELSGGQQSLLGLAFVFALSAYHSAPLYLLDEVSASQPLLLLLLLLQLVLQQLLLLC